MKLIPGKANGKTVYLGLHATEESAGRAYDAFTRPIQGEYGCYNFPEPGERSALTGEIRPLEDS